MKTVMGVRVAVSYCFIGYDTEHCIRIVSAEAICGEQVQAHRS